MPPLSNSPEQAQSTTQAAQASVPADNNEATDAQQDSSSSVPNAIAQDLSAAQRGSLEKLHWDMLKESSVNVHAAVVLIVKMLLLAQPVTAQTQLATRNGLQIHTLSVLLKAIDSKGSTPSAQTQLEAFMRPAMVLFQQAVSLMPEQHHDASLWSTHQVIHRILRCRSLIACAGREFCKQGMHHAQPLYSAWFACCNAPYALGVLMYEIHTYDELHVAELSCITLLRTY